MFINFPKKNQVRCLLLYYFHLIFCFLFSFVPFLCPTPLLLCVFPQGFDPPHQSETRTVYVANRFPQHGHYVPQRFADNRIISSKVLNVVEASIGIFPLLLSLQDIMSVRIRLQVFSLNTHIVISFYYCCLTVTIMFFNVLYKNTMLWLTVSVKQRINASCLYVSGTVLASSYEIS